MSNALLRAGVPCVQPFRTAQELPWKASTAQLLGPCRDTLRSRRCAAPLLLNSECCGFPCSQVLCFRCNWWILWTAEERGCDKLQMGSSVATGSGHDWALSECVRVAGILHRREYLHQPRCSYGHLSKRSICLTVMISVLWIFGICYFETPV